MPENHNFFSLFNMCFFSFLFSRISTSYFEKIENEYPEFSVNGGVLNIVGNEVQNKLWGKLNA